MSTSLGWVSDLPAFEWFLQCLLFRTESRLNEMFRHVHRRTQSYDIRQTPSCWTCRIYWYLTLGPPPAHVPDRLPYKIARGPRVKLCRRQRILPFRFVCASK